MSTSSATHKVSYAGNGTTTVFAFSYPFHAQADLVVVDRVDATGVETTKTLTTHYTISGTLTNGVYESGGSVTMLSAPASGHTLIIYRDPARTQTTSWTENDPDPAKVKEQAFDKLTFIVQRLAEMLGRAPLFAEGSDFSGITMPELEADTLLGVNSDGDGLELFDQGAAELSAYTPITYGIATETNVQDALDYLNRRVRGSRASPVAVTIAGITALSCADQTWYVQGSGGAIDLTAVDPNISAGTRVGQRIQLVGCHDTNTLTIFGNNTNKMITNGARVLQDGSVWAGEWNGTAWQETYFNNL
jgi:hypothetical protein